ncbi:hypothetical protein RCH23_001230 [Cryobacterium sp. CAN_C3]|nr:hypothetical protein [Cryobacterium sp. CAN_C3]
MWGIGSKVSRVRPGAWFGIATVLTVLGYIGTEHPFWALVWAIPHALILIGIWRGSRMAWVFLVSVSVVLALALAVAGLGVAFGSGFFVDVYWWGPVAHSTALLALLAYRVAKQTSGRLQDEPSVRAGTLSIRASEPHPIVRLSPTGRAEEHQWWCGSAPLVLPVTDYAVARAVCSLML